MRQHRAEVPQDGQRKLAHYPGGPLTTQPFPHLTLQNPLSDANKPA